MPSRSVCPSVWLSRTCIVSIISSNFFTIRLPPWDGWTDRHCQAVISHCISIEYFCMYYSTVGLLNWWWTMKVSFFLQLRTLSYFALSCNLAAVFFFSCFLGSLITFLSVKTTTTTTTILRLNILIECITRWCIKNRCLSNCWWCFMICPKCRMLLCH